MEGNMQIKSQFDAGHEDFIHDLAFNFYGNRMIVHLYIIQTCSSDQKLKVWDLIDDKWELSDSWKVI
jgi:nucleoporin SEH1